MQFMVGSVLIPALLIVFAFAFSNGQTPGEELIAVVAVAMAIGTLNLHFCRLGLWSSTSALVAYGLAAAFALTGWSMWWGFAIACGRYNNCL